MARLLQQYSAAPTTLRTVFALRHFNTSQQYFIAILRSNIAAAHRSIASLKFATIRVACVSALSFTSRNAKQQ
jgi:hypothetical protein